MESLSVSRRKLWLTLLFSSSLLAVLFSMMGGTMVHAAPLNNSAYYVNCADGSNGTGSQSSPWNTLSSVNATTFLPGDSILFARGSTCTGTLQPTGSGAAGAPITIDAYGSGSAPQINGAGAQNAIHLVNLSYWTIQNLNISDPATTTSQRAGVEYDVTNGNTYYGITIKNLEVHDVAGVVVKNGGPYDLSGGIIVGMLGTGIVNGLLIQGNNVHDNGGGGIKTIGAQNPALMQNILVQNNAVNSDGGDGIVIEDAASPLVQYNTSTNLGNGNYPSQSEAFAGMWAWNSSNPTFQFNVVGNIASTGGNGDREAWDCDGNITGTCLYQYNYDYNNSGGIILYCSACDNPQPPSHVIFRYNISQNDCRSVDSSAPNSTIEFYNNVIYCPNQQLNIGFPNRNGSTSTIQNNIWVAKSGSSLPAGNTGYIYQANDYVGFTPPVTPGGADTHGLTSDPQFVAAGSGGTTLTSVSGYALRAGSPAIGHGLVVSNNGGRDYFGNPVSATAAPNIGAYSGSNAFFTSLESGDPQLTWINSVDNGGGASGGSFNVTGICCGLTGAEENISTERAHSGSRSLLYSGLAQGGSRTYAYTRVFDLSSQNVVVQSGTTLSYWIYPQSASDWPGYISNPNSTCVAIDMIFTGGSDLRDSGAIDQNGNRLHPGAQCGHLVPDQWNYVTSTIGAKVSGRTIARIDVGYDQSGSTGGYRGYIDDISIS